jgi:hypothetical protein
MKFEKKLIVAFVIAFTIAFDSGAQEHKHLQLPLMAADSKIDSLFEVIISQASHNSVYYSLSIMQSGDKILYGIMELKTKRNAIYLPFMQPKYMRNFAYFRYKGHVVFINSDQRINKFFKPIKKKRLFDFKWDKKNIYEDSNDFFSENYIYKNGKFSRENYELR